MRIASILLIPVLICGCSTSHIRPSKEDISLLHELIDQNIVDQQSMRPKIPLKNKEEIREAKEVYKAFWNPVDLERYGDLQWGYDLYAPAKYLIIQTEIQIAVRKASDWPTDYNYDSDNILQSEWESVMLQHPRYYSLNQDDWSVCESSNFYPKITIPDKTVLYLTPKLKSDLTNYLGEDFTEFGTPSIMSTSQAQNRSAERLAATKNELMIFSGHWGDRWHFISHPEIQSIFFSHDFTNALIAFRIGYEGGYSSLIKNKDKWEFVDSYMYWVE